MLRKSFVSVIIRFRVKAPENTFRFEMMHRTPRNPTTVNRVRQPAAFGHFLRLRRQEKKKQPDKPLKNSCFCFIIEH
jgi:hypothetical protein